MTLNQFMIIIRDIQICHGIKEITGNQIKIWYEVCKIIPYGNQLIDIRNKILEKSYISKNIGGEIYTLWKDLYETKMYNISISKKCSECDILHFIYCWKKINKNNSCNNVGYKMFLHPCICHPSHHGLTKQDLIKNGFIVIPKNWETGILSFERELCKK